MVEVKKHLSVTEVVVSYRPSSMMNFESVFQLP